MSNQKQNVQPDFSFITKQQVPQKKTHDKKLVIILILFGLLVVMGAVLLVSGKAKPKNSPIAIRADSPALAVQDYLKAVNSEQYDKAYNYFSSNAKVDKQQYLQYTGKLLKASNNLSGCVITVPDETKPLRVLVSCPYGNSPTKSSGQYDMVKVNGGYLISNVTVMKQTTP